MQYKRKKKDLDRTIYARDMLRAERRARQDRADKQAKDRADKQAKDRDDLQEQDEDEP